MAEKSCTVGIKVLLAEKKSYWQEKFLLAEKVLLAEKSPTGGKKILLAEEKNHWRNNSINIEKAVRGL